MIFSIAILVQRLRLWLIWVIWTSEMFYYSLVRFRFFWLGLRGREEEINAIKTRLVAKWMGKIIGRLHCRIEVEGREHVPQTGPLVVMSNHQSMYDIPLLMAQMGRMVGFVAKKELFHIPGFSYWMREIGSVNLDRSNPRAASRMFKEVAAQMKEKGSALVLFPEGTRSRHPEGELSPFKDGSLRLPQQGGIPILPVSIDGTRFFSKPEAVMATARGGRVVRIRIAPVMVPDPEANARERKEFMARLRETIEGNFQKIRVHWPDFQGEDSATDHKGGK